MAVRRPAAGAGLLLLLVSALAATASAKHIQQVRTGTCPIASRGLSEAAGSQHWAISNW
jgi:hypothetical protein